MSTGTDLAASEPILGAATAAGLVVDPDFDSADLATLAGPFITMNLPGGGPTDVAACIAVRDTMSNDESILEALATAVASSLGSGDAPETAGPVGTGTELTLRFSTPVAAVGLTDGTEVQAVLITQDERRAGETSDAPVPAGGSSAAMSAEPMSPAVSQPGGSVGGATVGSLDKLSNVGLEVSVELGRTSVTLAEVLDFHVGSVIELDRAAGAPVDIRINGMLLAQGEVVLIDDEYAVRVIAIFDPDADA